MGEWEVDGEGEEEEVWVKEGHWEGERGSLWMDDRVGRGETTRVFAGGGGGRCR